MERMRIGTAATLIALAALDMTLVREVPGRFLVLPPIAILIASLNLAAVQSFALRRPLGAFHLGFIAAGILFNFATIGRRTRILATLVARYRLLTGDMTPRWFDRPNSLLVAESWLILALGLLVCAAGGLLASRGMARVGRRGRAVSVTPGP